MFCAKCGVELANSEKNCPLCGTRAYHPDITREEGEPPYPKKDLPKEEFNRAGILFIITTLFALPFLLAPICDVSITGKVTWSAYVSLSVLLAYIVLILPAWFRKWHPIIFVPIDCGCAGLFVLYICLATGGNWFLSFAFPVILMLSALICSVVILCTLLKRGRLYIFGGAFLGLSAIMPLTEFFIHLTFNLREHHLWSIYPMTAFFLIGAMLITIAICRPLRESLHKKFFI